jgi:uncharacterized protein (TIGR00251 family)
VSGFVRALADGVTLTLKVQPKASRDAIAGVIDTPDGPALKVAVSAPPDKGKANAAVIGLLAKSFGVAKSRVTLTHGETDRRKVVRINGDPKALTAIAQQWMRP